MSEALELEHLDSKDAAGIARPGLWRLSVTRELRLSVDLREQLQALGYVANP